jgi:primosomal protein N' (replication factor Y)
MPRPRQCPNCEAEDSLVACGPGIERLAEEFRGYFPKARVALMASDAIASPRQAAELVAAIHAHEIDVIIGTQLVAKGHHFPKLTLVGVVDGDLGLSGGDLRAAERTYQLLSQVAGRAGREERPGRCLVQTYMPEHPVMQALASGDRERFVEIEMADRAAAGMPPYGRLAALVLSGYEPKELDESCRALARIAPHRRDFRVLGPAPAPLAMIRGRHRRRFLVKAGRDVAVQPVLRDWLSQVKLPGGVRLSVDIDPYSFL